MTKALVFIAAVIILVAGYFVFFYEPQVPLAEDLTTAETAEAVTGFVTATNFEGMMVDGPALITIRETASGEERVIAVPSMGLPLCAAVANITPVSVIVPGDLLSVAGETDEEGRIVPCADASHHLAVVAAVRDEEAGYQFLYPKGPVGYVVVENTGSTHADFLSGVTLFDRVEYQAFQESTDAREGPPAMHVRVYENPAKLQPGVWAMRNPLESNVELALADPTEAVVGGANAEHYVADGLFPISTYIVAHGGRMYVLEGMYPSQDAAIYNDFNALVASFTFIPLGQES